MAPTEVTKPIEEASPHKASKPRKAPHEVTSVTETETTKSPVLVLTVPNTNQSNFEKPILKAKQQIVPIQNNPKVIFNFGF